MTNDKDPIAKTYAKIYPKLFKKFDKMPKSLQKHVRYPKKLFEIQSVVYKKYHMDDVKVFYQSEDIWDIAKEIFGTDETYMTSLSDTSISATSGMTKTKAAALLNQQKWTQAQSAYTSLFVLFPEDMDIVRGLAKAAKGNQDYSRAMVFFEQLAVHFPSDITVWQDLADVYTALGNTPAANWARALQKKSRAAKKSSLLTVHSWLAL